MRNLPSSWRRPLLAEPMFTRLLDEVFGDFSDIGFDIAPNVGKADVYEKDGKVIHELELPGMEKDEIEIKIDQGRMTVSGEIKRREDIGRKDYSGSAVDMATSAGVFRCPQISPIRLRSPHRSVAESPQSPYRLRGHQGVNQADHSQGRVAEGRRGRDETTGTDQAVTPAHRQVR